MAETFDALLNSLGFGASNAAQQEGIISRKTELGKETVGLGAEEERRQLNAGYEGRGVFGSGEALLGNARLEASTANKLSALDIAGADEYLALQRQLQQDQAAKEAGDRQFNLQVELANRQYDMQRQQIAAESESRRRQDEAYERAQAAARNY
jgi:hypothetical protein